MANRDYYNILGVPRTATPEDIKRAYRKLAHQYHPDKQGGDDIKFKEINEAYQILSNPNKRSNYDNFGYAYSEGGFQGGGGGGYEYDFSNFWDMFGGRQKGGFEDIFDFFSDMGGGQYRQATKGEDLYLEISISKKDLGTTKYYEYEIQDYCPECVGSGIAKGYSVKTCSACNGLGQVQKTTRGGFGFFSQISICRACGGKGKVSEKECPHCRASGRLKMKKNIEIRIPRDVEREYTIIVPKGGNAGREGQPPGDIVISLKLK